MLEIISITRDGSSLRQATFCRAFSKFSKLFEVKMNCGRYAIS